MDTIEYVGNRIGSYVQQAAIPFANGTLAGLVVQSVSPWEVGLVTGLIEIIYEISKEIFHHVPLLNEPFKNYNFSTHQIKWIKVLSYLICGVVVCNAATLIGVQSIETSVALLLTIAAAVGRLANQKLHEMHSVRYNPESEQNKKERADIKADKLKLEKEIETLRQKETDFLQREMTLKTALEHLTESEENANKLLLEAQEKTVALEEQQAALKRERLAFESEKQTFAQAKRRENIKGGQITT